MFSDTDITYTLSGGSDNRNRDLSLGGQPSAQPIVGTLHNLFNPLDDDVLDTGWVDWRCFYVFNDSPDYILYDAQLYIISETSGGANVDLGFFIQNEQQQITFSSTPSSGVVGFRYENQTIPTEWRGTFSDLAAQLVAGINNFLAKTVASYTTTGLSITLTFSDAKYLPPLEVVANTTGTTIVIQKIRNGSPVNAVSVQIDSPTTPPSGVAYSYPTEIDPFSVGDLYPSDGFPVWVRRTVPAGADSVRLDGFTVNLRGYPALPGHPHNPIPPVPPPSNVYFYTMTGGITISGQANAQLIISDYFYTGTGGVNISGSAVVSMDHYFYTGTGGIIIGGSAELPVSCPSFCCIEGNIPWVYYTLSVSGISNETIQDPACQCSLLSSSTTLVFNYDDCKWYGTFDDFFSGKQQTVKWILERDRLTGDWTLSGCAGGCTALTVVWPSNQFLCCEREEFGGSTFNKAVLPTTPDEDLNPGETNIVIINDNCKLDPGFSLTISSPEYLEENTEFIENPPITGGYYGAVTGHCYCAAYTWSVNLTATNCNGTVTCNSCTFFLERYAEKLWSSLQPSSGATNYVTLEYIPVGNLWRVTLHNGDTNAVWELADASFACCNQTNTFELVSTSCDPITVPSTIDLYPLDCVEPTPENGIVVRGCAEYNQDCVPCETIPYPPELHPEWLSVGWSGFGGLPPIDPSDPSKGVYAGPNDLFPIFFNIMRDGEYGSAICSGWVEARTGGPGQTAVQGTYPSGDYSTGPEPQHVVFNCGTSFWSSGVQIHPEATSGAVIVFYFSDTNGCTINPDQEFFKVIIV